MTTFLLVVSVLMFLAICACLGFMSWLVVRQGFGTLPLQTSGNNLSARERQAELVRIREQYDRGEVDRPAYDNMVALLQRYEQQPGQRAA